jgi:hypothetical protein
MASGALHLCDNDGEASKLMLVESDLFRIGVGIVPARVALW